MSLEIAFTVDGEPWKITAEPGETLLEVLRRQGKVGVKHGCDDGSCGVCAVLLDGRLVHSCLLLAARAGGHVITTIEGLGDRERLHPLQAAFVAQGAVQCGYCTPAMVLAAFALLRENPRPTEEEVREALAGVLCRCTGYVKPVEAVTRAAEALRAGGT